MSARRDASASGGAGAVWSWFARNSDAAAVRLARAGLERALRYLHAENHDPRTNGEAFLLDALGASAEVIVDVGAYEGAWALEAASRCPNATIYAFELSSETRADLARRVANEPRIRVWETGLLDEAGVVRTKRYPDAPAWTSVYDYPHDARAVWTDERAATGDEFLAEAGIDRIDLLKIDTEGSEMRVLRGFRRSLEAGAVRVIQFEYGYAAVVSHALLRDFYELLEGYGYALGRLRPRGVEFAPYAIVHETFFGPNFVAVHASDRALVDALGARQGQRAAGP